CWDSEPSNRPPTNQIVERLECILYKKSPPIYEKRPNTVDNNQNAKNINENNHTVVNNNQNIEQIYENNQTAVDDNKNVEHSPNINSQSVVEQAAWKNNIRIVVGIGKFLNFLSLINLPF